MGVGKTYTEQQSERVAYGECGTVIAAGSVSSHMMTRPGPRSNYRPTLPARHSLSLPFCVCLPYPRQPPTVARLSPVSGPCPTGVTGDADCLPDISLQAYPVEDGYQGAESALEPGGVRRGDHTVVGV